MDLEELRHAYEKEGWLIPSSELHIEKLLGRGASGDTYKGEYQGQPVAIKRYSPNILRREADSVKQELTILANLKHPNVIEFCGLCISQNPQSASLVTKYAPNGDLSCVLYPKSFFKSLDELTRFNIAIGLAKGLQYLHGQNIVHRDLKPQNVLLKQDSTPMLTDFGFSRFIDTEGVMTGETGSYTYMAPEMIRHDQYDASIDVYSFGILINEIFSRSIPFPNLLPIHAALGVAKKGLRPSQRNIKNERLKELIRKCWDQNPKLRAEWPHIIETLEELRKEAVEELENKKNKTWKPSWTPW